MLGTVEINCLHWKYLCMVPTHSQEELSGTRVTIKSRMMKGDSWSISQQGDFQVQSIKTLRSVDLH